jgi:hypothetical protein
VIIDRKDLKLVFASLAASEGARGNLVGAALDENHMAKEADTVWAGEV